jgi:hypothetical protein
VEQPVPSLPFDLLPAPQQVASETQRTLGIEWCKHLLHWLTTLLGLFGDLAWSLMSPRCAQAGLFWP